MENTPVGIRNKVADSIKKCRKFIQQTTVDRAPTDAERARIQNALMEVRRKSNVLSKILDSLQVIYVKVPKNPPDEGRVTRTFSVDPYDNIRINIGFANSLTDEQLIGVLCHEALHLFFSHHKRIMGRTPFQFVNISMDAFINDGLAAEGFQLPPAGVQAYGNMLYITALYVEQAVPEISIANPKLIKLRVNLKGETWESVFDELIAKLTIPEEARKLREFNVGEVVYDPTLKQYGKIVQTGYGSEKQIYVQELTPQEALAAAKANAEKQGMI